MLRAAVAGAVAGAVDLRATPLAEWPMLLTHDAATGYLPNPLSPVYAWTRTQPPSQAAFTEQLDCGARAFDFRSAVDARGGLVFHHGGVTVEHAVAEALQEIVAWANRHTAAEDLVVVYAWDCVGAGCDANLTKAFAAAGVAEVSDCEEVANMTLGSANERARLTGGGHVLALRGCVDSNDVPRNACSGFGGSDSDEAAAVAALCGPGPRSVEALVACGQRLGRGTAHAADVRGLTTYHCWTGSPTRGLPVGRMVRYLRSVGAKAPRGRLQEMQCLWQESVASIVLGVLHVSSLLRDERKSGLNALALELITNGTLPHISLFEVNNVCDGGPALRGALLAHAQSRAARGPPAPTVM